MIAAAVSIRPGLKWLCAATVVGSMMVYLVDPGTEHGVSPLALATTLPVTTRPSLAVAATSRATLAMASADPFEPVVVAPPPAPPAKLTPPLPPPPPPIPTISWRYFGQMTFPDNKQQVFLARGDLVQPIEAGQRLDDGFIVEAITPENVRLRHVESGVQFLISLPELSAAAAQ